MNELKFGLVPARHSLALVSAPREEIVGCLLLRFLPTEDYVGVWGSIMPPDRLDPVIKLGPHRELTFYNESAEQVLSEPRFSGGPRPELTRRFRLSRETDQKMEDGSVIPNILYVICAGFYVVGLTLPALQIIRISNVRPDLGWSLNASGRVIMRLI